MLLLFPVIRCFLSITLVPFGRFWLCSCFSNAIVLLERFPTFVSDALKSLSNGLRLLLKSCSLFRKVCSFFSNVRVRWSGWLLFLRCCSPVRMACSNFILHSGLFRAFCFCLSKARIPLERFSNVSQVTCSSPFRLPHGLVTFARLLFLKCPSPFRTVC